MTGRLQRVVECQHTSLYANTVTGKVICMQCGAVRPMSPPKPPEPHLRRIK